MNDWLIIILATVAGYIVIAGMLEYQRQDVSGQIDKYFEKEDDRKSFYTVISDTHTPSDFWLHILIGGGLLAFFGRDMLKKIYLRVLLYCAPVIFIVQIVLLEYSIQSIELMLVAYLLSIVITLIFCKYQEVFVGLCTGLISSYFMHYMMTQDYHRQRQVPGITSIFPMYLAGVLFSVAISIYAYGNLDKFENALYIRYTAVHLCTYFIGCLYLGYYNVHLTIAAHKIQNHQYENHIEHIAIYYGLFMTFIVGGGFLINQLVWVYGDKFQPFFLISPKSGPKKKKLLPPYCFESELKKQRELQKQQESKQTIND